MERARSPNAKKAKVQGLDFSMPSVSGGKRQTTIKSFGVDGENRDKYVRKNPRNGKVQNQVPIEVCIMIIWVIRVN